MARLPRFDLPGHLHLVLQRARDSAPAFVDDQDRRRYLEALLQATRECAVAVHAYALLDDQVLMLVTPAESGALARFMQAVGRRYVKAFNHRHGRRGSPWAGRYRTTVVDPDLGLAACTRLIVQMPVRDGRASRPGDWAWSSAAHHSGTKRDVLVTEHPGHWQWGNTPFEREARYLSEAAIPVPTVEANRLLDAVAHGWPIGSKDFVAAVARVSSRPVRPRTRGRRPRVFDPAPI